MTENKGKLWCFGSNYTADYVINEETKEDHPYVRYKGWRNHLNGTPNQALPNTWSNILAGLLDLEHHNQAIMGSSNYLIFDQWAKKCKDIKKGDRVMIEWVSPQSYQVAKAGPGVAKEELHGQLVFFDQIHPEMKGKQAKNRKSEHWYQELFGWMELIKEISMLKEVDLHFWSFHDEDIMEYFNKHLIRHLRRYVFNLENMGHSRHRYKVTTQERIGISHPDYIGAQLKAAPFDMLTITGETRGEIVDPHMSEVGHQAQAHYFYNEIQNAKRSLI